ncbi:MAG: sigma-70 family RNA polymerase sigma factor [Alistipes sp.]|nr:sigma-70 family RNA polymerase sigma factor [Alistipes sp.]
MTDSQLIFGILQNDERAWRYICREMKPGFVSIVGRVFSEHNVHDQDVEDIFQESLIVLMQRVKSGCVASLRDGGLFSYLVQIGRFTACNLLRKKRLNISNEVVTSASDLHNIEAGELAVDE